MNNPEIITENEKYFAINKPANMATEPPSNGKTLRDWLIETGRIKVGEWEKDSRYGVVHRLDTDTSGIIIWARTPEAQAELRMLWHGRAVEKTYLGLVAGETQATGTIELPVMRDNKNDRQTVALLPNPKARPAITTFERLGVGNTAGHIASFIKAHPITGRTHQIRVHMKSAGHPVVGDKLYGDKEAIWLGKQLELNRHWLHASVLKFNGQSYFAELPDELTTVLKKLGIPFENSPALG